MLLFIFDQQQVIAEAVPTFWTVEHLDVIEGILLYFFLSSLRLATDLLSLKKLKEALGYGVIAGVSSLAHALLQVMFIQEVASVAAAEAAALIGMHHRLIDRDLVRIAVRFYGMALSKKRFAAAMSRFAVSRNSTVLPCLSTAR
jgi:hypothetical protein